MEGLTTTSFAILGHLAMRPWTMYELATQMRRNVHFFYPRAESQIYAEPKRLVRLKLARATRMAVGKRSRTLYEITPAGRKRLAAWLAQPPSRGISLEFESLLRVFLAPFGEERDLAATLAAARSDIAGLLATSDLVRTEYLAGRAPFQEYAPTRAMVHDFLTGFAELVDGWAARSAARVAEWEKESDTARAAVAVETFRANRLRNLKESPLPVSRRVSPDRR